VVQVVVNPLIVLLGKPATAHSRLTFAQAFNRSNDDLSICRLGADLVLLATVERTRSRGALDVSRARDAPIS
jgi:FHS family L-fucose permease-like MFS transporter